MRSDSAGAPPLARDYADFLTALSGAFQRAQMYPEGHPTLDRAIEQVVHQLVPVLAERPAAAFAVAPTQLFVGTAATDQDQPLLRELAGRLFRRNVGTIKLARGITRAELTELLSAITRDASDLVRLRTPHLEVEPLNFEGLSLDALEQAGRHEMSPGGMAIWSALANVMLGRSEDSGPVPGAGGDKVAASFDALPPDAARDGVVIEYLHEAAAASSDRGSSQSQMLRRQVSHLLRELRPATIERLLRRAPGGDKGHRLLRDLAGLASAPAALGVLQAAARVEGRELSAPLTRLLDKLARHTEDGPLTSRYLAGTQFFALVNEVISSWESPGTALVEPVDHLPPPLVPGLSGADAYRSDPYRVLTMELDMGELGSAAERAVGTLVARGTVRPLVDLMLALPADDPVSRAYRPLLAGSGALEALLAATPVDAASVEHLAPEVGPAAIPLLLDSLASSEERSLRRHLLQLLAHFGNDVVPHVTGRLAGAPWYVQRNLLRLLQMLPDPPPVALAVEYSRHKDARVRVEGFRLLIRHPDARARGIVEGLSDPDTSGVRVAVMAAGEDCPPAAAPLILRGLAQGRIEPGLVPSALRALGPMVKEPGVIEVLLSYGGRKLPLLGWRVAAKSKNTLAALSALARHWKDDPRAAPLLSRARGHPDAEIREAVSP